MSGTKKPQGSLPCLQPISRDTSTTYPYIDRESLSITLKARQFVDRFLYEEAIELINIAIQKDQKNCIAYLSKAMLLSIVGDITGMNHLLEMTLKKFPMCRYDVASIRSYVYASNGDFLAGANELKIIRCRDEAFTDSYISWDGVSELNGKTILVKGGRTFGYGTLILLSRCIEEMSKNADHIYFEVPEGYDLKLRANNVSLIKNGEDAKNVDLAFTYLAMQEYFWRNAERMGNIKGYLSASREQRKIESSGLASTLRIGLCWRGGGANGNKNRFIDLDFLIPALQSNATFISLQKRPTQKEFELYDRFNIDHRAAWFSKWSTTADIVKSLDIVISVDTAIAHLAGAVGVPVWLLLPHYPEWHFYGNPIAWYEGFTVYRQPTPGDWFTPISNIKHDLQTLAAP